MNNLHRFDENRNLNKYYNNYKQVFKKMKNINWGIIGLGNIANKFAESFSEV